MADRIQTLTTASRRPQLLSVRDTARAIDMSERYVWTLLSVGALTSIKIGRRRVIDVRDIERFIEEHKEIRQ